MDEVLGQAQAVAGNLGQQGRIFENIGSKLENVASKFPMVSGLLNAIRRKKSKVHPPFKFTANNMRFSRSSRNSLPIFMRGRLRKSGR